MIQAGLAALRRHARSSTRSTSKTATAPSTRFHKVLTLAARVRRRRRVHVHRQRGPGPHAGVEAPGREADPRPRRRTATACATTTCIFDALALSIGTGLEESRGDGASTIEGIRLISQELPNCYTTLGLSNVSFGLEPGAASRHQLGVPARVRARPGSTPPSPTPAASAAQPHRRRRQEARARPHLRPPHRRLRPAHDPARTCSRA